MSYVEKFFAGAFMLILVYLALKDSTAVNEIFTGLSDSTGSVFKVLQGR